MLDVETEPSSSATVEGWEVSKHDSHLFSVTLHSSKNDSRLLAIQVT